MQAFIDACEDGSLNATISIVISNNPDAAGLQRATRAGLKTAVIDHRQYNSRETFDAALVTEIHRHDADLVILAGFMRILTQVFIEPFAGRLMNIHPSLLPKYPGLNTHLRAIQARDKEAGVTVHYVTMELDGGPPIIQARVPILPGDDATSLAARVTLEEHVIYPIAARWHLESRLRLVGDGVLLDGEAVPATGIHYADLSD